MPCESNQSALTEAAAGAPATAALRSHLIVCADCRAALAAKEVLLSSIDAGLRLAANAEVPASLVPSVRARLNEPAPRKRWFLPVLVPAAAVLVLAAYAAHSLRQTSTNPSKSAPLNEAASVALQTPIAPLPSQENALSSTHPDRGRVAEASRAAHRAALRQDAAEKQDTLEVLVPQDQEALLASYAQQWRTHKYVRVIAEEIPKPTLEPVEITPIQIDVHDVKLLTDSDSR